MSKLEKLEQAAEDTRRQIEALEAMIENPPEPPVVRKRPRNWRRNTKTNTFHFVGQQGEFECEQCGVIFTRSLPAPWEGRVCGSNCAEILLSGARERLHATVTLAKAVDILADPARAEHHKGAWAAMLKWRREHGDLPKKFEWHGHDHVAEPRKTFP